MCHDMPLLIQTRNLRAERVISGLEEERQPRHLFFPHPQYLSLGRRLIPMNIPMNIPMERLHACAWHGMAELGNRTSYIDLPDDVCTCDVM
jgi:hypothetical protein